MFSSLLQGLVPDEDETAGSGDDEEASAAEAQPQQVRLPALDLYFDVRICVVRHAAKGVFSSWSHCCTLLETSVTGRRVLKTRDIWRSRMEEAMSTF